MIAFGCSITSRETFERVALPGIELAREADCVVLDWDTGGDAAMTHGDGPDRPLARYNRMLDEMSERDDLEAFVLIHQDLEIVDEQFPEKVRREFRDPGVAIIGNAGGRGVRSIAWWEAEQVLGCWRWMYSDEDRVTLDATEWETFVAESLEGSHEADAVDGMFQVLSPWAVRELRFDEAINAGGLHGGDVDACFQARAAGKSVVVADVKTIHHHAMTVLGADTSSWVEAHVRFARKWEGRSPGVAAAQDGRTWEDRARLAEAEAAAARLRRNELSLIRNEADKRFADAHARQGALADEVGRLERWVAQLQETIDEMQSSRSWRLTSPLRDLGKLVRRPRDGSDSPPGHSGAGR